MTFTAANNIKEKSTYSRREIVDTSPITGENLLTMTFHGLICIAGYIEFIKQVV